MFVRSPKTTFQFRKGVTKRTLQPKNIFYTNIGTRIRYSHVERKKIPKKERIHHQIWWMLFLVTQTDYAGSVTHFSCAFDFVCLSNVLPATILSKFVERIFRNEAFVVVSDDSFLCPRPPRPGDTTSGAQARQDGRRRHDDSIGCAIHHAFHHAFLVSLHDAIHGPVLACSGTTGTFLRFGG